MSPPPGEPPTAGTGTDARLRASTRAFLAAVESGAALPAAELFPAIYAELRALAAHLLDGEARTATLQPTALVHEAYVKLAEGQAGARGRSHFLALAARAMKQVLVDRARAQKTDKRGGQLRRVTLTGVDAAGDGHDELELLAIHEAIEELHALDERQAEVVTLRFFGGLEVEEIAQVLGVSKSTIELDWRLSRAWLQVRLGPKA